VIVIRSDIVQSRLEVLSGEEERVMVLLDQLFSFRESLALVRVEIGPYSDDNNK